VHTPKSLALLTLLLLATGCSQQKAPESTNSPQRPLVFVTTDVLCDLTKQIAQTTVELKCAIAAGTDPHAYQATPADRQAIEKADLVLYAGHDFEPTLIKIIKATNSPAPKIAVNEVAVPQPFSPDHGRDPHVWHNAQHGMAMAKTIEARLTQLLPANRSRYQQQRTLLTDRLGQIDLWIKTQIATIPAPARQLFTTHDALGYYGRAYGLPIEGALQGLSTEEKPTAQRAKELVDRLKKSGVPMVFVEASSNSKLIASLAQEARVKISQDSLYADGLGPLGSNGDTYPKMLMANTRAIVTGLGGKYEPIKIP
jgi:manganese/iron transport system substrate-binding protein